MSCHSDWSGSRLCVHEITSSGFDFLSAIENTSVGFRASSASSGRRGGILLFSFLNVSLKSFIQFLHRSPPLLLWVMCQPLCCNYIGTSTYRRVRYTELKGADLTAREYNHAGIYYVTFTTTALLNHNILTFKKTPAMRLWTDKKGNPKNLPLCIDGKKHHYEFMPSVRHSVTASLRPDRSRFSCLFLLSV